MSAQVVLTTKREFTNFYLLFQIFDSGFAKEFDLKPTTLNVIAFLSKFYNPKTNIVFPSELTIAHGVNAGQRTIPRAINELIEKGLITKTKRGAGNAYIFTDVFFNYMENNINAKIAPATRHFDTPTPAILTHEHDNHEQDKNNKHTSCTDIKIIINNSNNDDDKLINPPIESIQYSKEEKARYKAIIQQLEKLNYCAPQHFIKKLGLDEAEKALQLVDDKNIQNPGAYLRSLSKIPNFRIITKEEKQLTNNLTQITKSLDDPTSYLNNYELAKIQIKSYDYHNKLTENELWHISALLTRYDFNNSNEYRVLNLLKHLLQDDLIKQKYDQITHQINTLSITKYQSDEKEIVIKEATNNDYCAPTAEFLELKQKLVVIPNCDKKAII